jgi:hypothetical protein
MKKTALLLLICIYFLSTFGISLKEFYCCGKLRSVTVTLQLNEIQKCNKRDDKSGCCKTKFRFYKVGDKHFGSNILSSPIKKFTDLPLFITYIPIRFPAAQQTEIANSNHAPPLYNGVAAYISNCVFRI